MIGLYAHPQVLALLHMAKEEPQDDGPRLVLSDWLEEYGDPARAEFLRLQLRLAPGPSLEPEQRVSMRQRMHDLLAHYGGGWLGPLWQHGGLWHRGLLTVRPDRLHVPAGLEAMRPWMDSALFEVPGREALRWALTLAAGLNHMTLELRRPFPAELLLALLGEAADLPCLRTLTFRWAPGMGKRVDERPFINLSEDFFAQMVKLPLCQHLTHLGSSFAFTEAQAAMLRAAGLERILARHPHWPHSVLPATLRR